MSRNMKTYEGVLFNVFTLSPEEMVREKINAYLERRRIRDLYDVFFTLKYTSRMGYKLRTLT